VQIIFKSSVYTQLNIFQCLVTHIINIKEEPYKDVSGEWCTFLTSVLNVGE
jgi:hypothetical protein